MRTFILICGGLLFANVAVMLWPTTNTVASHIYAQRADLNPHFLSLNKEVEERYYGSGDPAPVGSNDVTFGSCYRLGPFMELANYESAQSTLLGEQVNFQKTTRSSQNSGVYRVYLGPFQTQAQIDDARLDLKRQNILDHFAKKEEEQNYIISLGIYTTEDSASTALEIFSKDLDGVKMQSEQLDLPQTHWLHLTLDEEMGVRQELAAMDWGEVAVKLGKYECL